jgi:hypothetical protein
MKRPRINFDALQCNTRSAHRMSALLMEDRGQGFEFLWVVVALRLERTTHTDHETRHLHLHRNIGRGKRSSWCTRVENARCRGALACCCTRCTP